jgi:hypothetical protein
MMLQRDFPLDKIADWLAINGCRHSNQMVQRTFKIAGKADLIEYFIQEEDIKVGDTVKSRWSGRAGKVIGINKDDLDITVHWDAGGKQKIAKESVFKLRTQEIDSTKDIKRPHAINDDYGDIKK